MLFAFVVHNLVFLPAAGFLVAAATGVVVRARRAREDKSLRDLRFLDE